MTDSPIASATYVVFGAPSKEPFHNDALNRLESLAQITVATVTTVGPASPAQGTAYVVASVATGNFAAQENNVAAYYSGYFFLTAREGWKAFDQEAIHTLLFDGDQLGGGQQRLGAVLGRWIAYRLHHRANDLCHQRDGWSGTGVLGRHELAADARPCRR